MSLIDKLIECYNNNEFEPLRNLLSNDCIYTSQWVLDEMVGKNKITDYLISKSIRINECNIKVVAKKALIAYPYDGQECAVMFQGDLDNPSSLILIKESDNLINQIDICMPELFTLY